MLTRTETSYWNHSRGRRRSRLQMNGWRTVVGTCGGTGKLSALFAPYWTNVLRQAMGPGGGSRMRGSCSDGSGGTATEVCAHTARRCLMCMYARVPGSADSGRKDASWEAGAKCQMGEGRPGRHVGDVGHAELIGASRRRSSRSTRSGAGLDAAARFVVLPCRRRLTPLISAARMSRATRFTLTARPRAPSSA